ncbi:MAG: S46 family peptidase [Bacteroidales bacterium]|nr:S46 family peptidase [Bacteroidales bacterium]
MKKIIFGIFLFIFSSSVLFGDEGMWLLPLVEELNMPAMTEKGLKLSAEDIYSINHSSLKDAVVLFNGGCTAEIISSQGLLLTNHHCGLEYIQNHSSVSYNYIEDGYWATSKKEELPNPDLYVSFLIKMEDVTRQILDDIPDTLSERARYIKIEEKKKIIADSATADNNFEAAVESFFEDNVFYLVLYETFTDVRLVGAPPSSIGKFGYDNDNWTWPRHNADFSLFRIYCGKDGKPADFSEDNIPLRPDHYFPISLDGVSEGDFSFILGYPGTTERYLTSYGIQQLLEVTHPNRIKIRGMRQDILSQDMQQDEKVRIQYASKYSTSSNYWKFSIGQSKQLTQLNTAGKKKVLEDQFSLWARADSNSNSFANVLDNLKWAYQNSQSYEHTIQYINESFYLASEIIEFTTEIWIYLNDLVDEENEFQEKRDIVASIRSKAGTHFKDYNPETDKKITRAMCKLFQENVNPEFHPAFYQTINKRFKGDIDKYVDFLFDKSVFSSEEKFNNFLANPQNKTLRKDPAIAAVFTILLKYSQLIYAKSELDDILQTNKRLYIKGLKEMNPNLVKYPDANQTMRLTYGSVEGYFPRDAVHYKYFTTHTGVLEKEDSTLMDYRIPEKLKILFENKDFGPYGVGGELPVCFITNNDITGGNSGSPVINERGELIGLAFDGNWEGLTGDIQFEPNLQRCINVDIRYILFIIDKFSGASNIIDELTIVKSN